MTRDERQRYNQWKKLWQMSWDLFKFARKRKRILVFCHAWEYLGSEIKRVEDESGQLFRAERRRERRKAK